MDSNKLWMNPSKHPRNSAMFPQFYSAQIHGWTRKEWRNYISPKVQQSTPAPHPTGPEGPAPNLWFCCSSGIVLRTCRLPGKAQSFCMGSRGLSRAEPFLELLVPDLRQGSTQDFQLFFFELNVLQAQGNGEQHLYHLGIFTFLLHFLSVLIFFSRTSESISFGLVPRRQELQLNVRPIHSRKMPSLQNMKFPLQRLHMCTD